jgi:hypothetical protein
MIRRKIKIMKRIKSRIKIKSNIAHWPASLTLSRALNPLPTRNLHPDLTPVRLAAVLLTGGLLLGCNSAGSNLPRTVPAAGLVTLDGKPVDGAQVVLVTPPGQGVTGASGVTDSSGHFELRAYPEKPGAIPGDYKVQVSKTIQVKIEGAKGSVDGGDPVRYDYGVPAKYTDFKKSGLSVNIPDTGNKDIKLALTSK